MFLKLTNGSSSSLPALSGPRHATFLFSSRTWIFFFSSPQTATQGPTANPKSCVPKSKWVSRRWWGRRAGGREGGQGGTRHFVWCQCVFCVIAEWLTEFLRRPDNALPAFFSLFFFFSSLLNCLSGRLSHLVTPPVSASSSEVEPRLSVLSHLLPSPPYGMRRLKVVTTAGCPVCHTKRMKKKCIKTVINSKEISELCSCLCTIVRIIYILYILYSLSLWFFSTRIYNKCHHPLKINNL